VAIAVSKGREISTLWLIPVYLERAGLPSARRLFRFPPASVDILAVAGIYSGMKHLVDLDESALAKARAELGTTSIKETVNTALALAAESHQREDSVRQALDSLAEMELTDAQRSNAWR